MHVQRDAGNSDGQQAHRGLEDRQVKLGCVQPGEVVATFGDALRRLTDRATYLYVDGKRYWYSTQPTVTRLAEDRAGQLADPDVNDEIVRRLREEVKVNTFMGAQVGAFHIKPLQKINGRDNFNFAPFTRSKAESDLIIRLIKSY